MGDRRNPKQLIDRVAAALSGELSLAHQAMGVACDIYRLTLELDSDARVADLLRKWKAMSGQAFPDLLATRIAYFLRLAHYPGLLVGEELLKLLSLAEDIHVLMTFGAIVSSATMTELEDALRARLARQPELRTAAESLVEPSSRDVWCYRALGTVWGN